MIIDYCLIDYDNFQEQRSNFNLKSLQSLLE